MVSTVPVAGQAAQVAGVRIGVKAAVDQHHVQHRLGADAGQPMRIDARRPHPPGVICTSNWRSDTALVGPPPRLKARPLTCSIRSQAET